MKTSWFDRNSVNRSPWRHIALFLIPVLVSCFGLASAAAITVTNTNDSGIGSLRQAITDSSPGDTIDFDSSMNGQAITLMTGELVIDKNLTITGSGANLLAVDGNGFFIVFSINSGVEVSISGLTITHGNGGGIWSNGSGSLTIINSTLSDNAGGTLGGGGIHNEYGSLTIVSSTLSGNSADYGGGIFNFSGGSSLTITNSTLSGNIGIDEGGGIFNNGSTVMEIGNAIRKAGFQGANIVNAEGGTVTSLGYNISSDDGGGFLGAPGDQINTDPQFTSSASQDNGGPTFTLALLPTSPVITRGL